MDLDFVLKVAGIGMVVAISCQILSKVGRDDQGTLVSLAGIIAILVILFGQISELFDTVRGIFGI
ncbi:MAG: stage III sporulation protein AC [Clostridia bacterium]|nr:stage III sporulation protein AC [Clostridia bacterium]